jgi:hypothetical protein
MEAAVFAAIDMEAAMAQVRALVGFGEKVGGSPEELAAQQYIHDEFSKLPLDEVAMTSFPTSSWSHAGEQMIIVDPPSFMAEQIPTTVYAYSHGITGSWFGERYSNGNFARGTLRAEVVDVGFGTEAEFLAVGDLGGAIALVHRDDDLTGWPHVLALHAMEFGASAIVLYGYYGADGIKQDVLGVEIPAFSISVDSAARIKGGNRTWSRKMSPSRSMSRAISTAPDTPTSTSSFRPTSIPGGRGLRTTRPASLR